MTESREGNPFKGMKIDELRDRYDQADDTTYDSDGNLQSAIGAEISRRKGVNPNPDGIQLPGTPTPETPKLKKPKTQYRGISHPIDGSHFMQEQNRRSKNRHPR